MQPEIAKVIEILKVRRHKIDDAISALEKLENVADDAPQKIAGTPRTTKSYAARKVVKSAKEQPISEKRGPRALFSANQLDEMWDMYKKIFVDQPTGEVPVFGEALEDIHLLNMINARRRASGKQPVRMVG